jgi:replicative DNA helicase
VLETKLHKELPCSIDAERTLLGAVFIDDQSFHQIEGLNASLFYSPHHRDAFLAMQNLSLNDQAINPITAYEEIKRINPGTTLGVIELSGWTHGVPFYRDLSSLVATLKDKALRREIIKRCDALALRAVQDESTAIDIVAQAATTFQEAHTEGLEKQKPTVSLAEALDGNYERWEKMLRKEIVTIQTGIARVDDQLTGGGLEKGMFHVVGARPGKGKTSIGLDIAGYNALQGKVVVFFTLELSRDVLIDRFISPLSGIERYKITSKWMDQTDFARLVETGELIKAIPLHVNAKARTLKDMRLALKQVERERGQVDLIITDFLTKMRGGKGSKYESVSENANGLAEFGVEFNAASIALAQLSREVEKRQTVDESERGKVRLTDFRDSGEIEELGRTIFGLWGEDESQPLRDVTMSCLKQGEGRTFDEKLTFNTDTMTFGARRRVVAT